MIKLSERLQTVANFVTRSSRVADIGSDHALLPIYLVQNKISPSAIVGELTQGPLDAARKGIAAAGLTAAIDARQGNGLEALERGEADTVTICGMGGSLICDILESGRRAGKLDDVGQLVLQPNVGESFVRAWLLEHEWLLKDERILEEDGKIYEVLHAERTLDAAAANEALYDGTFLGIDRDPAWLKMMLIEMGPHLLRKPDAVLRKKWLLEIDKLERISAQLAQSSTEQSQQKQLEFRNGINAIKEVLECLRTDIQ